MYNQISRQHHMISFLFIFSLRAVNSYFKNFEMDNLCFIEFLLSTFLC